MLHVLVDAVMFLGVSCEGSVMTNEAMLDNREHLDSVADGDGCVEIWEKLSEKKTKRVQAWKTTDFC